MTENGKKRFHQTTTGKVTLASIGTGVGVFIAIYGFLNNYIDGRVTNHPTVQQSALIMEKMNNLKVQVEKLEGITTELNKTAVDLRIQVSKLEGQANVQPK